MNRFFSKATAVAALSFVAFATTAQAQDRLNFNGSARVADQPGSGGANLLIDFLAGVPEPITPGTPTGNVFAVPTITAGFMPGITNGTAGTIQDLVISSSGVVGLPVNNFLVMGGYTFSVTGAPAGTTFGPITLVDVGTGTNAFFGVSGTVTGGNFGATSRSYQGVFTAQFAGLTPAQVFNTINTGGSFPVAFSAEFVVASVVPEPSTYALMATGIGMLGVFAHRRRRTQV
jgi:hypothetical protein